MTHEEIRAKYEKYNVGQLKLIAKGKNIDAEKLEILNKLIEEKSGSKVGSEVKAPKEPKVTKEPKVKEPKAIKEPKIKEKKEPKVRIPRGDREPRNVDRDEPWAFNVGDTVIVTPAKNAKDKTVESGVIKKLIEWDEGDRKAYVIKTESGKTLPKRQSTLLAANPKNI